MTIAGSALAVAAGSGYLFSDKSNVTRQDIEKDHPIAVDLAGDERTILQLASLAPSGHNTQPWIVKYIEPYHWIICNDKDRWLPAVDPMQRETILSIGAFLQNLEYAASNFGYACQFKLLATSNQDEKIMEVQLVRNADVRPFDIEEIKLRRTVRSGYIKKVLSADDVLYLKADEKQFVHFFPAGSGEYREINALTLEANTVQNDRDDAQKELADWVRFSNKEAKKHLDGLTTAGMEINGVAGWWVRNFYGQKDVLSKSFRDQTIDKVKQQIESSGGWILISSDDDRVETLIETGKRLQRLLLKIRKKSIAIHPMTQILEEPHLSKDVHSLTGLNNPMQFILRAGYIRDYPPPVSLRRPVGMFVKP